MPSRYPVGVATNVEGVPQLRRLFRQAARRGIPLSLKSTHKDIGELVIRLARPRMQQLSGAYIASLRASNTSWVAQVRAGGRRRAPYAPILHWGSRYRPNNLARPAIADAAQDNVGRIERLYEMGLDGELRKISAEGI